MSEYQIKDPQEGLLGPVGESTVRDLLEAGVFTPGTMVAKDAGPFAPASSYPEFANLALPHYDAVPDFSGDLSSETFFRVFYRFHNFRATGSLVLQRDTRRKDVFLEEGRPAFVSSTVRDERLGQFLVRRGKLGEHQLVTALEAMRERGYQLGRTLIELGMIQAHDFYAELREQQVARLVELCAWDHGRYAFFDGERYTGEKFDLNIESAHLLLRAARSVSSQLMQKRLAPHAKQRVVAKPFDESQFPFTSMERRALSLIDGKKTVAEVLKQVGTDEARQAAGMMVLYLLWETDLLNFS